MTKEKEKEVKAKLQRVKIEPEELQQLSKETALKLSKVKKEVIEILESEDNKV